MSLERCNPAKRNDCKTIEDQDALFKNKDLVFLNNQVRFDSKEWGVESIKKESIMSWIKFSTKIPQ